jgi:hypothetical protein
MPQRFVGSVAPLVRHGLQELQYGLPVEHVLREVALMGALVGTGVTPTQAVQAVERVEPTLLGLARGEERESFHAGAAGAGAAPYGKGAAQFGMGPWATGAGTMGVPMYGQPSAFGKGGATPSMMMPGWMGK